MSGRRSLVYVAAGLLLAACHRAPSPGKARSIAAAPAPAVQPTPPVSISVVDGGPALAPRAFLLRFGDHLLPLICLRDGQLVNDARCIDSLPRALNVTTNHAYQRDGRARPAVRGTLNCEGAEEIVPAYVLGPETQPPVGEKPRWAEPGPMDGWAAWPPGAFDVSLSRFGQDDLHDGAVDRCDLAAWWPCTKRMRNELQSNADGGAQAPARLKHKLAPWVEPRAKAARRALASVLERLARSEGEGPLPITLLGTMDLDLDDDGIKVRVYNVAVTDFQVKGDGDSVELPGMLTFLLRDAGQDMERLTFTTPPPLTDPDSVFSVDGAIVGTFDLDGDGSPELWLEIPYFEGVSWQIVRTARGHFERLASFTCGT